MPPPEAELLPRMRQLWMVGLALEQRIPRPEVLVSVRPERMLAEQKESLARAQREASDLAKRSQADIAALRVELTARARKEADELVATARQQIQEEKAKAVVELNGQVVDMAIDAARKLIQSTIDEKTQRALVEEYVRQLPAGRA